MGHVWRMENDQGWGPYRCPTVSEDLWCEEQHGWENKHPNARHEVLEPSLRRRFIDKLTWCERNQWRFAFKTLKQAKRWFSASELERLRELGFELKKKEYAKVMHGNYQSVFVPKD